MASEQSIQVRRNAIDEGFRHCDERLDTVRLLQDLRKHRDARLIQQELSRDLAGLAARLEAGDGIGLAELERLTAEALAGEADEKRNHLVLRAAEAVHRALWRQFVRRRRTDLRTPRDRLRFRLALATAGLALVLGLGVGVLVVQSLRPPKYAWGTVLAMTAAHDPEVRPYLGAGWAPAEEGHTWTLGHEAELRFRSAAADRDLELVAEVWPFLAGGLTAQAVTVEINGRPAFQGTVSGPTTLRLPVPRPGRGETVRIRFLLPDARAPIAFNLGADSRILGLAFKSVVVQ